MSKDVFSAVDNHAWGRLMRWIRAKYAGKNRLGMKELRRRFCDVGWRIAHNGVAFTGASSVTITRYRYRGSRIPTQQLPTTGPVVDHVLDDPDHHGLGGVQLLPGRRGGEELLAAPAPDVGLISTDR